MSQAPTSSGSCGSRWTVDAGRPQARPAAGREEAVIAVEKVPANGLTLAYESFGDPGDPPLLLIMGLGVQMIGWREELCAMLADGGRFVIRFDNRDVGESTHIAAPMPDLRACLAGDTSSAVYSLEDMADDVDGLLEALELDSAHLVGASMGGMIAQTVAARHPARVRSLTSIMSTSGERGVSRPTAEASRVLLAPAARTREQAGDRALAASAVIGSPGYPTDEADVRDLAGRAFDRGHNPAGFARQLAGIWASGDRTQALRSISAPTLVIHGEEDPLVQPAAGRATAAAIPGAELWTIPGMGHDLPRALWPEIVRRILDFTG
ncbi:MAG: alpha/beta hydrolase [Thermoleophilaceae bacterium]